MYKFSYKICCMCKQMAHSYHALYLGESILATNCIFVRLYLL